MSPGTDRRRFLGGLVGGALGLRFATPLRAAPCSARPGPVALVPRPGVEALTALRSDPDSGVGTPDAVLFLPTAGGGDATPQGAQRLDLEGRAARDGDLRERVREARHLVLHGGDLVGWWSALHPRDEASPLVHALHHAWRRGASLTGIGGAASYLAGGGSALEGGWPWDERDPHERTPQGRALVGLSWAPLPLLGDAAAEDGDPHAAPPRPPAEASVAALLDAVQRHDLEAVAWFDGDVLALHRPERRDTALIGAGRLCVLYLDGVAHGLRRERAGRLLDLRGGSSFTVADGRLRVHAGGPLLGRREQGGTFRASDPERHGRHRLLLREDERTREVLAGAGAGTRVELHARLCSERVPVRRD